MLSCATINQLRLSPKNLASRHFPVEMINAVLNEQTGELIQYLQVMKCPKYRKLYAKSYSKELGQLAQGIPGVVDGTNNILFVDKTNVPAEQWKDATYGRVIVYYRPEKGDPYRTRLTVG